MDLLTIGQIINTTLVFATALIFASLGGIFSEKSGVTNLGLEGFMVFGAFAAESGRIMLKKRAWAERHRPGWGFC